MNESTSPVIRYCKAYMDEQLQKYPGWPDGTNSSSETPGVVFLHSDYVVRNGPEADAEIVHEDDSEAWLEFCRDHLLFDQSLAEISQRSE